MQEAIKTTSNYVQGQDFPTLHDVKLLSKPRPETKQLTLQDVKLLSEPMSKVLIWKTIQPFIQDNLRCKTWNCLAKTPENSTEICIW